MSDSEASSDQNSFASLLKHRHCIDLNRTSSKQQFSGSSFRSGRIHVLQHSAEASETSAWLIPYLPRRFGAIREIEVKLLPFLKSQLRLLSMALPVSRCALKCGLCVA
jgi:hypothetical protein